MPFYHTFKKNDKTAYLNELTSIIMPSGIYSGFDLSKPNSSKFRISHINKRRIFVNHEDYAGLPIEQDDLSISGGVFVTNSGVVIVDDSEFEFNMSSNTYGVERIDFIVLEYQYEPIIGGGLTYNIVLLAGNNLGEEPVIDESYQHVLYKLRIPIGATSNTHVTIPDKNVANFADDITVSHVNKDETFSGTKNFLGQVAHSRANAMLESLGGGNYKLSTEADPDKDLVNFYSSFSVVNATTYLRITQIDADLFTKASSTYAQTIGFVFYGQDIFFHTGVIYQSNNSPVYVRKGTVFYITKINTTYSISISDANTDTRLLGLTEQHSVNATVNSDKLDIGRSNFHILTRDLSGGAININSIKTYANTTITDRNTGTLHTLVIRCSNYNASNNLTSGITITPDVTPDSGYKTIKTFDGKAVSNLVYSDGHLVIQFVEFSDHYLLIDNTSKNNLAATLYSDFTDVSSGCFANIPNLLTLNTKKFLVYKEGGRVSMYGNVVTVATQNVVPNSNFNVGSVPYPPRTDRFVPIMVCYKNGNILGNAMLHINTSGVVTLKFGNSTFNDYFILLLDGVSYMI